MYEVVDMQEIQCALVNNNELNQYTQFNWPLTAKTNHRYQA